MDCVASPLPDLDLLQLGHDGPMPRAAVRSVLLGGDAAAEAAERAAALILHERLSAEARLGAALRRRSLPLRGCQGDAWLGRLAATLAHHRAAAVRLRSQRNAYSQ